MLGFCLPPAQLIFNTKNKCFSNQLNGIYGNLYIKTPYHLNYQHDSLRIVEAGNVILPLHTSFLGSTAQLRPWPPPQNPTEFLGGFSTIFIFTG
jgi:hypothetical protein